MICFSSLERLNKLRTNKSIFSLNNSKIIILRFYIVILNLFLISRLYFLDEIISLFKNIFDLKLG